MNQERLMTVLLGPHVSEKGHTAADKHNQIVFRVRRDANKAEIRRAVEAVVESLFGARIGNEADALARATLEVLHHIMGQARTFGVVPRWAPTRGNRRFKQALAVLDEAIYGTLGERRRAGTESRDDLGFRCAMTRVGTPTGF